MIRTFSEMVQNQEESARLFAEMTALRTARRMDPSFKGCDFCFDTAWGELKDGTIVPCADHNGLCL